MATGPEQSLGGNIPPSDTEKVTLLAGTFVDRVIKSQRFSWMGAVEHNDELGRNRMSVYLLDSTSQPDYTQIDKAQLEQLDVTTPFSELSDALRPHLLANIYFIDNTHPIEKVQKALPQLTGSNTPSRVIIDQILKS